jgi:hypothetical protein
MNHVHGINTIMHSKGASACGHRLVAAVEALLVATFVHRYGCNMTVGLNIDDRSRGTLHADVDMIEIF